MIAVLWVVEAILLGCLLVYRWTSLPAIAPRWAGWLLVFGAGAAIGIGATSSLFFVVGVLLKLPWVAMGIELAALAGTGFEIYRRRIPMGKSAPAGWLAAALVLAVGIATAAVAPAWDGNPHGRWDAWAIWNMRARFLDAPSELAPRAWSAELGQTSHREYPLLVSGFTARVWRYSGAQSAAAPIAASYVFFLALVAVAAGGMAALRGGILGWLAALVIATSPAIVHEVAAQYADIPLACYFAAAVLLALLDRPVPAGLCAGFAAWTKDEGMLFLAVFLVVTAIIKRRAVLAALAGAAPAGLLAAIFKFVVVRTNTSLAAAGMPGAGPRLADAGRYINVFGAFVREFLAMAETFYHPILPLIVLAVVLPFERERRRDVAFAGAILVLVLAGYFGIYIVTPNDLEWQLQTSLSRLLVQVWPLVAIAAIAGLRAPESMRIAAAAEPEPAAPSKKRRKR